MKTSAILADSKLKLSSIDAGDLGAAKDKETAKAQVREIAARLSELQEALFAENKRSLLLVFQATDTGGKDGAVKSLLTGVNPAGVQVTSFKAPSTEELEHDFLWRIHRAAPPKGIIGVWNRSHYEDVLITRVHKMIDAKTWTARYEDINAFEELLHRNGVTMLKFFLCISKDEQKKRLQTRLDDPTKHWKFNVGDLQEREYWNDYIAAYQDALRACSTKHSPWYVIPANKKWARDLAIAQIVLETLEKMAPQYPESEFDASKVVIPD